MLMTVFVKFAFKTEVDQKCGQVTTLGLESDYRHKLNDSQLNFDLEKEGFMVNSW